MTKDIKETGDKNKTIKSFISALEINAEYTHRHYVSDNEYIQHGENIEEFLKREIGKQIIRWQDSPQLGYEILPNKYFYTYQPPESADEILAAVLEAGERQRRICSKGLRMKTRQIQINSQFGSG